LHHATRSLQLCRAPGQQAGEADALNAVGFYAARLGQYDAARAYCQAALTRYRRHHNPAPGTPNASRSSSARSTGNPLEALRGLPLVVKVSLGHRPQLMASLRP
jgi:Asp-tRNA(Asn)/Glu-tRNA(Gln) amidotransferase A subunit family amidase